MNSPVNVICMFHFLIFSFSKYGKSYLPSNQSLIKQLTNKKMGLRNIKANRRETGIELRETKIELHKQGSFCANV